MPSLAGHGALPLRGRAFTLAPMAQALSLPAGGPPRPDWPEVDDHILASGCLFELIDGELIPVVPADEPHSAAHRDLVALLSSHAAPLWESGQHLVPTLPLGAPLIAELAHALDTGLACQGLEKIADTLAGEQKGLDVLKARAPESPQKRQSPLRQ